MFFPLTHSPVSVQTFESGDDRAAELDAPQAQLRNARRTFDKGVRWPKDAVSNVVLVCRRTGAWTEAWTACFTLATHCQDSTNLWLVQVAPASPTSPFPLFARKNRRRTRSPACWLSAVAVRSHHAVANTHWLRARKELGRPSVVSRERDPRGGPTTAWGEVLRCVDALPVGSSRLPARACESQAVGRVGRGVSNALGLSSSWHPVCHGIHARPRDNDNDNDTLSKVQPTSVSGLTLLLFRPK